MTGIVSSRRARRVLAGSSAVLNALTAGCTSIQTRAAKLGEAADQLTRLSVLTHSYLYVSSLGTAAGQSTQSHKRSDECACSVRHPRCVLLPEPGRRAHVS